MNENNMSPPQDEKNSTGESTQDSNHLTPEGKPAAPPMRNLDECEKECKENLEGWQRERAMFLNYKKEEGTRLASAAQDAQRVCIEELLPVLDSFDIAREVEKAMVEGQIQENGFRLIHVQILEAVRRIGVETISVSVGEPFNPEAHEILEDAASPYPAGTVAEVIQKGYRLNGMVIRPARIKISKEKAEL